jgi:hypothetical protein
MPRQGRSATRPGLKVPQAQENPSSEPNEIGLLGVGSPSEVEAADD